MLTHLDDLIGPTLVKVLFSNPAVS